MKPSLMWALVWPNSNVNTMQGLCPRWDARAVMATRWNMSIKRHSPPRGRYVQKAERGLLVPLLGEQKVCAVSRTEGIATRGGRSSEHMTPRRPPHLDPKG